MTVKSSETLLMNTEGHYQLLVSLWNSMMGKIVFKAMMMLSDVVEESLKNYSFVFKIKQIGFKLLPWSFWQLIRNQ